MTYALGHALGHALGLALATAFGAGPSPALWVGVALAALLHAARSRSGGGD
jgi:hypothetical protein